MSATMDNGTDWQRDVLEMKRQGLTSAQIAEAVGKHAATVRKVIARAKDGATGEVTFEGNGPGEPEPGEVLMNSRTGEEFEVIPGQTTVDDHLAHDDPDHPGWTGRDEFVAEAGEPVGDMPRQPEPEQVGYEVRLAGTRQMALDFGPNADVPVGGTLVLKSDKLASGFFGRGDVISGTFTARIVEVNGKEAFDGASEEFRAKPQHHVALITELSVGGDA